ncbi:MAG TPA: amino acid ABC transporter substrate-binding protein [Acidimicrobiia bacterium]
MKSSRKLMVLVAVLALFAAACTESSSGSTTTAANGNGGEEGSTLAAVMDRGEVRCGVNQTVPGFGFVDADGNYSGFDIDYCRAVAAAIFDDPDAVEYVPLDAGQRFTALASGEIDVLIRNTTWTSSRDGGEGATFLTTTFYDGQGMMVRTGEFESIDDMENTTICVLAGTTTELNLATRMEGMNYTPQTFANNEQIQQAFIEGACDGWTSDKSQLSAIRSAWPEGPEALTILDETFSKEPLGPAVRDGDSQWAQVIDWVVISTILAEELGITSDNVDTFDDTDNAEIRRLLGLEIETDDGPRVFDAGLGVEPDFARQVISHVGNYGEIFDRNVGPDTPLGLTRGLNALWTDGGLMYGPPHR